MKENEEFCEFLENFIMKTERMVKNLENTDFENFDPTEKADIWFADTLNTILQNDFNYPTEKAEKIAFSIPCNIRISVEEVGEREFRKLHKIIENFAKAIYTVDVKVSNSSWQNKEEIFFSMLPTMKFELEY